MSVNSEEMKFWQGVCADMVEDQKFYRQARIKSFETLNQTIKRIGRENLPRLDAGEIHGATTEPRRR